MGNESSIQNVVRVPPPHEAKQLNSPEMKEARAATLAVCPFVAQVMYQMLTIHSCSYVPTLATDGNKIYINEDYFNALDIKLRISALVHETLHALLLHIARALEHEVNGLGGQPFLHRLYNIAGDFVINSLIRDLGLPLKDSWLYRSERDKDKLVEDVYIELLQELPPPPPGGDDGEGGDGGDGGQGAGSQAGDEAGDDTGGGGRGINDRIKEQFGEGQDTHIYAEPEHSEVEWRQAVEAAAVAAKSQGDMPAALERLVKAAFEPRVDWRAELRAAVHRYGIKEERTWTRFSRRHLSNDMYLPGMTGFASGTVAIVADTSGSIGGNELTAFMSEISGILSEARPERLIFIPCDACVYEDHILDEADPADMVESLVSDIADNAVGGGGTSFVPPFNWLEEQGITPDFVVYLTDGYGPFPDDPGYPTIWVMTTDVESPIGKTIPITL